MIEYLKIIIKNKKFIIITTLAAIISSVIISMPVFMKPYYESMSVFYPSNPQLSNKQSIFGTTPADFFGTKEDVDRLLSIANSVELMNYAVEKYKLMEHYEIDPKESKYPQYEVKDEFTSNYKAIKSELGGIEVKMLDTDSALAAEIVNDIVAKTDEINRGYIRQSQEKTIATLKDKIERKQKEIQLLSDSMFSVRNTYKLIDQGDQGISSPNMTKNFEEYAKGVEKYRVLENKKKGISFELNEASTLLGQFEAVMNNQISSVYIIEKAYPADKKSKPTRWLIVTGAMLFAFFVSSLAAVLFEKYKDIKKLLSEHE